MAITKIYKGSIERIDIDKIYKGTTLLYEKSSLPSRYIQTTTADFNASGDYTGTAEYIILPEDKTSGYNITNINVKGVATNGDYLTDASNMFKGNNSLYLELDYLGTSKVTNMNYMFRDSKATTLDVSSFDTSNVTSMIRMFYLCEGLWNLNLSNFDTSKVTSMGYMFFNSKNLRSLNLSNFDTSKVTDMSYMFGNCYNLISLDISSFTHESITNKSDMFYSCKNCTVYFKDQDEIDFFTTGTKWVASNTAVIKGGEEIND